MANAIIATGNNANVIQPAPDMLMVAIKPTRARCAAYIIDNNIGQDAKNPMLVAIMDIFVTIICIWRAMKLSDAPI